MKKVLLIVCVATMLVGMVAASASASTTNWVVMIKASNIDYNNGGSATTMGVYTTALTPSNASWPTTSGAAATAVDAGGSYYSKQILAAGGDKTWGLKVGARAEFPISTVRISLWNTALDAASRDTLLDTSNIYTLYHGQDLVAWFSNAAKSDDTRYASNLWFDVSTLLQVKGWNPTAAMTGWYKDVTVVKGAGFAGIDSYSFGSITTYTPPITEPTPEPGSLLALGSGMVGLFGFAVRRRRA